LLLQCAHLLVSGFHIPQHILQHRLVARHELRHLHVNLMTTLTERKTYNLELVPSIRIENELRNLTLILHSQRG
jgi:hypothetical protein